MKISAALALLSLVAASAIPALADTYTYTLANPNPTIAAGNMMTFDGTITADAGNQADLYPLSTYFNVGAPLSLDESDFYDDTPEYLVPGESYIGPLFTVTVPGTTAAGTYDGFFDVVLADSMGNNLEEDQTFAVTVPGGSSVTPEPGSWLLLTTGMAGLSLLRRRYSL